MIEELYTSLVREMSQLTSTQTVICVVSKQQPVEKIRALYCLGVRDFGENRPLELKEKAEFFLSEGITDIRWHFIGHIQSRQIPLILKYSFLIHSVDRKDILLKLEERAQALGLFPQVLLQVNVSGEASKQGFSESEILWLASELTPLQHLAICGLMTMAPEGMEPRLLRDIFKKTSVLAQKLQGYWPKCHELSMGMSQDFSEALLEGATILRIGSKIFK